VSVGAAMVHWELWSHTSLSSAFVEIGSDDRIQIEFLASSDDLSLPARPLLDSSSLAFALLTLGARKSARALSFEETIMYESM
jgi:hypothetical protein